MILSTKLLRRINKTAGKVCDHCDTPAEYYDAALPVEKFTFYCGNHAFLEDLDPEDMLNQHLLTGAYVSRKSAFPECLDIEELFARATPVPVNGRRHSLQMWANVVNSPELQKGDVVARPATVEFIKENSIYGVTGLDSHHYVQINRCADEGLAFITLKFQQILGSRLLAIVPWKTVENFFGVSSK